MRKEEEARLSLLDERIVSIQQSRDLLQQRADQQSYEIAELRKLERQRVQEQVGRRRQGVWARWFSDALRPMVFFLRLSKRGWVSMQCMGICNVFWEINAIWGLGSFPDSSVTL